MIFRAQTLLLALPLIAAEPAGYKYWSASELKGYEKKLAAKLTPTNRVTTDEVINSGYYFAVMAHREANTPAEMHDDWTDVYTIISGTAVMEIGGAITDGKTTAPGETRGPSIKGATKQKVSPGDIIHIPPKTPHNVILEPGAQLTYMVFKVKRQ